MTREEAIEFGNMWLQINECYKDSSTYEFFQIAFKVLEQEPVLDEIIAEIEQEKVGYPPSAAEYKTINKVLQIIDRYKTVMEEI